MKEGLSLKSIILNRENELKAAIIIAEASKLIVNDIMNNHGIEFKIFIDDLLKKEDQIVKFRIAENSVVLANQKKQKERNLIDEVMTRLEESKTRREKRKILEQYDLIEKGWGEYNKYDIRRKVARERHKQKDKVNIQF